MGRFQRVGHVAVAILAYTAAAIKAEAQDAAVSQADGIGQLRSQVSELGRALIQAEALAEELEEEEKLLATAPQGAEEVDARPLVAQKELWDEALGKAMLGEDADARPPEILTRLTNSLKLVRDEEDVALAAWSSSMKMGLDFEDRVAKAEHWIGRPWNASALSEGLSLSLIGLGMLAVLGGWLLTLHEARNRIRWRLRALGSRPSVVVIALALAMSTVGMLGGAAGEHGGPEAVEPGETPRHSAGDLTDRRDELKQRLTELERANLAATQRLETVLSQARRSRATYALKGEEPWQKQRIARAEAIEADVQKWFREIRASARTAARAVAGAKQIESNLTRDNAQLVKFVEDSRNAAFRSSIMRLVVCGVFVLAAIVPLTHVRGRRRKKLNDESRKCPRCLRKDTLQNGGDNSDSEDDRRPKDRLARCDACEYEIRENYIHEHRLCFPTVGIPSSGKTHWLAMLYRQIKNTNVQVESKIKKIPSLEDERFNEMLEEILYRRHGTSATTYGRLPYPLTFHVNDNDRLGPSRTMVNIFDFSGELTHFHIDGEARQNEFRRRALLCEGFTLFLDPTQVTRQSQSTIERQVDALAAFIAEIHAMRGIPTEQPIDLPIAICISKMDLLVSENPIGTRSLGVVAELRQTMGQTPTRRLIHQRSQLIASVLPEIFPNWSIERELRENFGGRYMFFPVSSVGLDEQELGVKNFAERAISPFGVLEPLLWLLHMHGYCILS